MYWQDIVMSMANLLFAYSLVYQVYYGYRKKKWLLTLTTSSITVIGLYATSIALFTLQMYMASVMSAVNGTLWLILFIQRLIYKKA